MTCGALLGCRFEYGYRLALDQLHVLVALGTLEAAVLAGKRERGPPVMIESRRRPAGRVVTVGADRGAVGPRELPQMNFLMALLALLGGGLEVHFFERNFRPRRLVALDARRGSVLADPRKA